MLNESISNGIRRQGDAASRSHNQDRISLEFVRNNIRLNLVKVLVFVRGFRILQIRQKGHCNEPEISDYFHHYISRCFLHHYSLVICRGNHPSSIALARGSP
jgi:hypothetical protein